MECLVVLSDSVRGWILHFRIHRNFFYAYHHPLAYSFNRFILNRPHDYLTAIIGDENGNMVSKSKGLLNSNRVHHYVPCNSQLFDPYISPVYAHVRVTYVSKL